MDVAARAFSLRWRMPSPAISEIVKYVLTLSWGAADCTSCSEVVQLYSYGNCVDADCEYTVDAAVLASIAPSTDYAVDLAAANAARAVMRHMHAHSHAQRGCARAWQKC